MTTLEFIKESEKNYQQCVDILKRKNADYASDSNPFANFSLIEAHGYSIPTGLVVRLGDKFSRIANLIKKRESGQVNQVLDESIQDTLLDMINYCNILKVYLDDKSKEEKSLPENKEYQDFTKLIQRDVVNGKSTFSNMVPNYVRDDEI